ncbi:MAG TPA: DNA-directed RNA polymerase subunit alpha [bacterium]|nr:DNA-directed RNA polymerase subunit alpha [bacterium]
MIPLPLKPKIIKKQKNKAIFEIEALYPGYGVTIGNSLRRVLLSSLGGAAVTQVKIKNVSHEFSTIPGVLEDVINIMLNLKQMRFKVLSEEPQKAILKVKGEKEVKGSDFKMPSQLELFNKDCHIVTLTDSKASLEMEIQVERGIGYVSRELRKKEKQEIGVIALDAIFTPIKRVAIKTENMRVGKKTDFDRLILEIETDGTISPEDAFSQASEVLLKHFNLFSESLVKKPVQKKEKKKPAKKEKKEEKKDEKKKKRKKTKKNE